VLLVNYYSLSVQLLESIARTTYVDAVYYYRPSRLVCPYVSRSVTLVSPAKTAKPIEMLFGLRNRLGPGNHVLLDGVQITHLFCSLAVLDPWVGHTMNVLSPFISILCHSDRLFHYSAESTVHDLMLSIQAVRGLPRLHPPGIVPCIIYFSKKFPCFLMV